MKKIVIVGAGGFGREAYYLINDINKVKPEYDIVGFLDDNPNALEGKKINCPIIGNVNDWVPSEDEVYAMGIASPNTKEKIASILKSKGAQFVTLIHPNAFINIRTCPCQLASCQLRISGIHKRIADYLSHKVREIMRKQSTITNQRDFAGSCCGHFPNNLNIF